jgi:hypothetical protein
MMLANKNRLQIIIIYVYTMTGRFFLFCLQAFSKKHDIELLYTHTVPASSAVCHN